MKIKLFHLWHHNKPAIFAGAVSLAVLLAVAWHLFDRHRFIRTNDALVNAHFTTLTAKVPGIVDTIYVREMQKVVKGQLLARIEASDYRYQVEQKRSGAESSKILKLLEAKDFARSQSLFKSGAVSEQELRSDETNFRSAQSDEAGAQAKLDEAELNLGYTFVRAPADGIIAGRAIELGTMLSAGDPLYGFVYPSVKWVDARMKEIDIADLKIGEEAMVEIDAIPGKKFKGTVESIGGSTEGIEAVIPPDNSAGNYTKYVQRVPVRVALQLNEAEQEAVRVGLSAEVNVRRMQ